MANKRIKDLTQTATTLASDDYVAIDGSSNGTRKIVKGDLVNDISSQVAGTYLDEANNLSDVASLDTSKLNLEVPDVGTAPNEVPLNGMLGDMAFQSSDGVSMVNAEVETLEVTDKVTGTLDVEQSSGTLTTPSSVTTLRVNNSGSASNSAAVAVTSGASGSSFVLLGDNENDDIGYIKYSNQYNQLQFATAATDRVTIDSSGNVGIGKTPGTKLDVMQTGDSVKADFTNNVNANFRIKTSGANTQIGPSTASNLELQTQNITRWTVHSSNGNLIASSGVGIDFGSNANAAGATSELLDDYETGTWSPVFAPQSGSFTSVSMVVINARYTKIGNRVIATCYVSTNGVNTTGGTGPVTVTGLPFSVIGFNAATVGYATNWIGHPGGAYTQDGTSYVVLANRTTSISGPVSAGNVSDLNTAAGSANNLMISVTYTTA